ncbi:MAG: sugar phosphate isomerase/epimerase [Flavobacterium sp.]|nr:sugar phosphate isomerase/epimerase [Flavobacterium sp.]MBP8157841.1 sugar phosphate isomerase/epimerase [Flavobacterium sp.]
MDRRKFLTKTAQASALLAVMPNMSFANANFSNGVFKDFGIQLWTLRDVIEGNFKNTIGEVAKMGYTQIESFEGKEGIFWGMKPKDFKSFLNDNGLQFVSTHCDWKTDLARKADEVASIGGKYIICPWLGPQKSIDDFKRFTDEFNTAGAICKKAGIKFAYHNHDYSFKELDGQIPQQLMMDGTSADLVDFEMDIYWVVTAGIDPIDYMKKYENRFKLCHIKDRLKNTEEAFASCTLGEGKINYHSILQQAKKLNMEYFIYEQEKYSDKGVLFDAAQSAAYLKKMQK